MQRSGFQSWQSGYIDYSGLGSGLQRGHSWPNKVGWGKAVDHRTKLMMLRRVSNQPGATDVLQAADFGLVTVTSLDDRLGGLHCRPIGGRGEG